MQVGISYKAKKQKRNFCFGLNRLEVCPCWFPGSVIGGIKSTQDCVDFCAANNILPDVKVVPVTELKNVYDILMKKNDQIIRYVLDIENTMKAAHEEA